MWLDVDGGFLFWLRWQNTYTSLEGMCNDISDQPRLTQDMRGQATSQRIFYLEANDGLH